MLEEPLNPPIKQDQVFKIDDASWHIGSIDENLSEEDRWDLATTHMGLLVRWCFLRGFEVTEEEDFGEIIDDRERNLLKRVKTGESTGTQYLGSVNDYKLTSDLFSATIRPFLWAYCRKEPMQFLIDYDRIFGPDVYRCRERDFDFSLFCKMMDERLSEYRNANGNDQEFRSRLGFE